MADSGEMQRLYDELMGQRAYGTIDSCEVEIPKPFCLIVFGASGDLTQRKIMPALYRLHRDRLLPEEFLVLGTGRTALTDAAFRGLMKEAVRQALLNDFDNASWREFSQRLYYHAIDYESAGGYRRLRKRLTGLEAKRGTGGNRIFYLAIPPPVYETVIRNLGNAGLSGNGAGYTHVVIEKPIGRDLASARQLNGTLKEFFAERQVYRMDHYLAKETVQNILMLRFANAIFEPLWDSRYIDYVQITVSETLGVEHRAGYYEKAGVIRDMFQNHIFQLLALTAMEPPSIFESERVRDEKVKVFRSLRPLPLDRINEHVVIGQYGPGTVEGREVPGYRDEQGVSPSSATPTYAAMKVFIDNWRWYGIPFYLRSGKRLMRKKAEISVRFRPVPHLMFSKTLRESIEPNTLTLRLQPDEGISLTFQAKVPGSRVCLDPVEMNFSYQKVSSLSDYERVLLDCMQGDQMLFVRSDGVVETWSFLTPILDRLESPEYPAEFPNYEAGSAGPDEAVRLLSRDERIWRPL